MDYGNFWVCSLTQEQHDRTCGYWFTVSCAATSHTAFANRAALLNWLRDRNITIDESELAEAGTHSWQKAGGRYRRAMHFDMDEFYSLPAVKRTETLSNGEYVDAIITEDNDGIRTEHTLNPNVKGRKTYDYLTMRDKHN